MEQSLLVHSIRYLTETVVVVGPGLGFGWEIEPGLVEMLLLLLGPIESMFDFFFSTFHLVLSLLVSVRPVPH